MRFMYCRQEGKTICSRCGSYFTVSEIMVGLFYVNTAGDKRFRMFHTECYRDWLVDRFEVSLQNWLEHPESQKHVGRKAQYSDVQRKEINKVRTLMAYYRDKGEIGKALGLAIKLEELRGKNTGSDGTVKDTVPLLQEADTDEELQGEEVSGEVPGM